MHVHGRKVFLPQQPHVSIRIHHDTHVHNTRIIHDCIKPQVQGTQKVHLCKI